MNSPPDTLFTHIVYRLDHPEDRLRLIRKKLFWFSIAALGWLFITSLISHWLRASANLNTFWINSLTHSLFESYCSIISLTISYVVYRDYRASGKRSSLFLLFAFTSMGIFDISHAFANHSVTLFVWFHCLSAFCGGMFFLLSARAVRQGRQDPRWRQRLQVFTGISLAVALVILMAKYSNLLPGAITAETIKHDPADLPYILYFTYSVDAVSICATAFFLLSGILFARYFSRSNDLLFYILSLASFLFFESELLFAFSNLWDLTWWYWHVIKLIIFIGLSISFAHGFTRTFRELSESRRTLSHTVDELKHAYNDLKATQEVLLESEKLASIGKMAAAISHEIRNPLGAIKNSVGIFKRHARLAAEDGELLDIIGKEINRLDTIISDFLGFAKPHPLNRTPTDLNALIDETISLIAPGGSSGPSVQINKLLSRDLPKVLVDSNAMKQVLWNILLNAFQATPDNGTLTIRSFGPEAAESTPPACPGISIIISDTGSGMSPNTCSKAMQPFYSTKSKGTGLGLSISDRIIKQHGGRITLTSTIGEGTRVRIDLPLSSDQLPVAEVRRDVVHIDR